MPSSHLSARLSSARGDRRPRARRQRSGASVARLALSATASLALVLGLAGASLPATAGHDDVAADPAELEVEPRDGTELEDSVGDPGVHDASDEPAADAVAEHVPVEESEAGSPESGEAVSSLNVSADDVGMVAPGAAGPDGAAPPYVYWTVEDAAGIAVGGASLDIQ